jgi:hypothetical protein
VSVDLMEIKHELKPSVGYKNSLNLKHGSIYEVSNA